MEKLGEKLLILSLASHSYNKDKEPVSYEPYVREINLWSALFEEVIILTIIHPFEVSKVHKFSKFRDNNIKLINLWSFDASKSFFDKIGVIFSIPFFTLQFIYYSLKSDFINIRNSGVFSIILGLVTRLLNKSTITKWAGSYSSYKNESVLTKIDRKVVNIYHKRHRVLVYDKVKRKHFVNFIPALMSREEILYSRELSRNKPSIHQRLEMVSIGRLYWAKNFELIIEALSLLKKDISVNFDWHFHMIGDGDLKEKIYNRAKELNLLEKITFYGGLPFHEAQNILARSHVLIMPGVMEGWPKPIAEAWAHNCFPLAANRGNVPDIIDTEEKGISFEPTKKDLMLSIKKAYNHLFDMDENINSNKYVQEYSLEMFQKRIIEIIKLLK